jgi:hypothetical protein
VEIYAHADPSQALVVNSGGFPYVISQPGSYRLAGNLTVSGAPFVNGILISANNVTLDLNGFSIIAGAGITNDGISDGGNLTGLTIRNGTISGFGNWGIDASRSSAVVEGIIVTGNSNGGITVGAHSRLSGNTATGSAFGLFANCRTNIIGNTAGGNHSGDIATNGTDCTRYNNNPAP